MSAFSRFKRLPVVAAAGSMVLVMAACAIQLRGDGDEAASKLGGLTDHGPLASSLARCRTVTPEQTTTSTTAAGSGLRTDAGFSVRREVWRLPLAVMRSPANRLSRRQRIRAGCRKVIRRWPSRRASKP